VKFVYDELNADYRSRGNLLSARRKADMAQADSDANDIVISSTYEPNFNQPKTITDALGHVTTYSYDYELPTGDTKYSQAGNPVKVTYHTVAKGTPEVNFTYNSYGQVVETSDANGKVTQYTYYPDTGYLKDIIQDPAGVNAITTMTYDNYGNIASVTDPESRTTNYAYDALGWLNKVTTPLGFETKYFHDANGNVARIERQASTDGSQWQITSMTYDILNHLKTTTDRAVQKI
jgi:YD repeat-containing protein